MPDDACESISAERRPGFVVEACRTIEAAAEPPSLDQLASAARLSRFQFHRAFTAETGVTPKAYATAVRVGRMRASLRDAPSVTDAAYDAGFGSASRFYATADGHLGMTPSTFRAGGPEVEVRFAVGECSLGSVLVAATARGICAIELGDDPDVLVRDLQDRFHAADLVGDDGAFAELVARVVALVEDPARGIDLPLDVRGTAFQQRVWQALREIPAGTTTTYGELARRIGAPGSARAVAGACAANHLAVAIPCHRVVRQDGAVSGYRWGVDRKAALLTREAHMRR